MAKIFHDDSADIRLVQSKRVAIVGYGSQGHAHALNLRDSGVEVTVGLPRESRSCIKAERDGLRVSTTAETAEWADIIMLLAPDTAQPAIYLQDIYRFLNSGKMLMFAHGFNIRFGTIRTPSNIDVTLVAPKAPGHRVREVFQEGGGTPALLAIHQNSSGEAQQLALSYAKALGTTRAGVLETSFAEETETDLFGEQAVLCGGTSALVKAGFETLVEAGYQPEVAYFECLHELKLIVDLMYQGGLSYMRYSISDTAEQGDYLAGSRIVTEETRAAMRRLLSEIQDGSFAQAWIDENQQGRPGFLAARESERSHPIEQVGSKLRSLMPFLRPIAMNKNNQGSDTVSAASVSGPDGYSE